MHLTFNQLSTYSVSIICSFYNWRNWLPKVTWLGSRSDKIWTQVWLIPKAALLLRHRDALPPTTPRADDLQQTISAVASPFGTHVWLRLYWGCLFLSERAADDSVLLQDEKCQSLGKLAFTKNCNGTHKIRLVQKE